MDEKSVSGDNVEQTHNYEPGWSEGVPAVESKPVAQDHMYEPGWSNRGAVMAPDAAEVKVVAEESVEDKVVDEPEDKAVKAPAKKAAAKKTAAKKG